MRAGVHVGLVEMRGDQVTGLGVHVAARVMGITPEGQILVTEAVARALRGSIQIREAGSRQLRGVPGTWRLFEVIRS